MDVSVDGAILHFEIPVAIFFVFTLKEVKGMRKAV